MIGLLVFGAGAALIFYICLVFIVGGKIQDWALAHDYPDIMLPWAFSMLALVVLPVSVIAAVSA